jgi:DNA N-6-adenine-methyltransferase (Dam)
MQLVKYENARQALAVIHDVDEIKDIRDKAVAMQAYAEQAKDTALIGYATGIRLRAERRAGELLAEMQKAKGAAGNPGGRGAKIVRSPDATAQSPKLSDLGISKTQSSRWQQLAKLPDDKFEAKVERAKSAAEDKTTSAPRHAKSEYTGETEWYTPAEFLTAARAVMGSIDLDPASSIQAQQTVQASAFHTIEDSGLAHEWRGRVWLNPPYRQPYIAEFVAKIVGEVEAGRVTEAIMLTHNYTDTEWFHRGFAACSAICFTRGRVKFVDVNGEIAAPTQGQSFFYFGRNVAKFEHVFGEYGAVAIPSAMPAAFAIAA